MPKKKLKLKEPKVKKGRWKDVDFGKGGQLFLLKKELKYKHTYPKGTLGVAVGVRETSKGKEYYCNLHHTQTILHEDDIDLQYNSWSQILFRYSSWSAEKVPILRKKIFQILTPKKRKW